MKNFKITIIFKQDPDGEEIKNESNMKVIIREAFEYILEGNDEIEIISIEKV